MDELGKNVCAICGDKRLASDVWFLVAENRWEDKLRILQWNDCLAAHRGISRACSAAHVEELVVHWMTTGSLDYPFARIGWGARQARRYSTLWTVKDEVDTKEAQQIGELAVHRESMERVLTESPQSLRAILDALLSAMRSETMRLPAKADAAEEVSRAVLQEV